MAAECGPDIISLDGAEWRDGSHAYPATEETRGSGSRPTVGNNWQPPRLVGWEPRRPTAGTNRHLMCDRDGHVATPIAISTDRRCAACSYTERDDDSKDEGAPARNRDVSSRELTGPRHGLQG